MSMPAGRAKEHSRAPHHSPCARVGESGIIKGMVEYVSLAVLALHRDFFDYVAHKAASANG